jgi:hypothetical protein
MLIMTFILILYLSLFNNLIIPYLTIVGLVLILMSEDMLYSIESLYLLQYPIHLSLLYILDLYPIYPVSGYHIKESSILVIIFDLLNYSLIHPHSLEYRSQNYYYLSKNASLSWQVIYFDHPF